MTTISTVIPNCTRLVALGLLAMITFAGCWDSRPDTIPVEGRLTYGGGDWPKGGFIYFTPLEPAEGFPRRPGKATFETDGRFRAKTWEEGYGLMPGKYRVAIECWEVPPTMGGPPSISYVPMDLRVAAMSKWEIEVLPGREALELERDVPKIK